MKVRVDVGARICVGVYMCACVYVCAWMYIYLKIGVDVIACMEKVYLSVWVQVPVDDVNTFDPLIQMDVIWLR